MVFLEKENNGDTLQEILENRRNFLEMFCKRRPLFLLYSWIIFIYVYICMCVYMCTCVYVRDVTINREPAENRFNRHDSNS